MSGYPEALWRLVRTAQPEGLHREGPDWKCKCPAHRDAVASLAIKVTADGKLLLKCHAGCDTRTVLERWGVEWGVLFPDEPMPNGSSTFSSRSSSSSRSSAPPRGEPEAVYDYVDEQGRLLFQVCRFPDKTFRQRRPLEGGGWAWNLQHTRRVLYHLDALVRRSDETVFVCEGEKDAARLAAEGLLATTSPMGAGKWRKDYSELLRGRRVVILPDNDDPGREHAQVVGDHLLGVSAEVKTLPLEGLPEHGDVSDWLDAGGTVEELLELAENARSSFPTYKGGNEERESVADGWQLVSATEMLAEEDIEPPDLVKGLLPAGGLGILAAKPKAGKSTMARCLALAVAQGREFMARECMKGPVIYLALEEKRREVREHLRELGMQPGDPLYVHFGATPEDGLEKLVKVIADLGPVLCIIDPLFRFTRVRDTSAYAEITNALGPVLAVARKSGCHLLLVHHNTKLEREGADDILGSTAIFGAVDTAIILRRRGNGLRFAFSIQRYGVDMPNTVLQLRGPLVVAAGELEHHELDSMKDRIVEFLAQESPAAELAVRENVEGKTEHIVKALRQLVDAGRIGRSGTGKKGDPYQYSLTPVAPETPAAHQGQTEVCPACGHPERDIVTGSGVSPSWRCLQCGQLYGQLSLTGNEQDEQAEEVQQDDQDDQNRQDGQDDVPT